MKLSISSALLITGLTSTATAGIPAVCWDVCNDALLEGQRNGWNDNAICGQNTVFRDLKYSCWLCCYNNAALLLNFADTSFLEVTKHC